MNPDPDPTRVLVGVDGSASSVEALRYADGVSKALGRPLEVITTWVSPMSGGYYSRGEWPPEDDAQAAQRDAIATVFGDTPPPRLSARVVPGPAASTLIEESKTAGMLVLGSRGHGGFAGMMLGSVSSACAHHAHCPVLIVRGPAPDGAAASISAQQDAG
ncbi:universal stress protein [Microbacterium sp. BK668]|uniref:universal stress protein n=1 Tax=Microbacterium sp. BK668 TaxID=2512118 RepID=UPI00105CE51F|nr:universal stress protein [Microbacterium sp. BK668]TDN91605.1 nucleotide-binding universal stress UspA family protein [Microbacterium sp. BK668]